MNKSTVEKYTPYIIWAFLVLFLSICSYFVVYNAQWLIGDDAIVIRHTGFGHFFKPSDTIQPEIGRFFPFTYLQYNILPLFSNGRISATTVYTYQMVIMVLFALFGFLLTLDILKEKPSSWKYPIAFLITVFLVGRHYSNYVNCFSTSWFGSFINIISISFLYLFHTRERISYAILSFIAFTYSNYCSEVHFIVPLVIGTGALILMRKKLTKKEKLFYLSLILSSIVFLLIYYFKVYIHITSAYDSSHGEEVSLLGNAFNMLFAQKFIWLIFFVALIRFFDIIKNKKGFNFYDILILAAAGHCVGGFILKLNWTLYYNRAIIIALPSVIYFLNIWLKPKYLCTVALCFAVFYGIKIPKAISVSQENRSESYYFVHSLTNLLDDGQRIVFYYPEDETNDFNGVLRNWIYSSLQTYLAYELNQENLFIKRISSIDAVDENSIVLSSDYNNLITTEGDKVFNDNYVPIISDKTRNLVVYKKNK